VFAGEEIEALTVISVISGEIKAQKDAQYFFKQCRNHFTFDEKDLDDSKVEKEVKKRNFPLVIDNSEIGNEVTFMRTSTSPNTKFENKQQTLEKKGLLGIIMVVSTRKIHKGEEIFLSSDFKNRNKSCVKAGKREECLDLK